MLQQFQYLCLFKRRLTHPRQAQLDAKFLLCSGCGNFESIAIYGKYDAKTHGRPGKYVCWPIHAGGLSRLYLLYLCTLVSRSLDLLNRLRRAIRISSTSIEQILRIFRVNAAQCYTGTWKLIPLNETVKRTRR